MPDPFTDGEGELQRAEHISPRKTGDNIQAKRTANYVWDGANWQRMTQPGGSSGTVSNMLLIEGFESATGVTANADVTSITTSTTHLGQGSYSLSFAKSGTATNFALLEKTLTSVDISDYSGSHDIEWKLYLSSIANITTVYVALGSALTACCFWEVPVTELLAGWNMPQRPIEEPTGQLGAGADLAAITWVGVFIGFTSAANTLTGILVDNIELHPAELHRTEKLLDSAKLSSGYAWQATSNDGTYKYFFFENASTDYYIMRKHIANKVATYTKGVGGYASVYQSPTLGPSGSPTWASYGNVF